MTLDQAVMCGVDDKVSSLTAFEAIAVAEQYRQAFENVKRLRDCLEVGHWENIPGGIRWSVPDADGKYTEFTPQRMPPTDLCL